MVNKKISVSIDDDKFDQIINNLNKSGSNSTSEPPITRQPTIIDEYLEILKMRREVAYTLYKQYLMNLIQSGAEPEAVEKVVTYIGMFLGIGDRWSNDVLKTAINGEIGMYGGFAGKIFPDYIGDPVANYERSQAIGVKDDTAVLLANLMQLLGINLSPEMIDKIVKMLKDKTGNK